MAKIGHPKEAGKRSEVMEKSGKIHGFFFECQLCGCIVL